MQNASVNFAQAASGAGGTWVDPQVKADWLVNGFGRLGARENTWFVYDSFSRTVQAGTLGWGTSDSGHQWGTFRNNFASSNVADFSVDGSNGVVSISEAGDTVRLALISGAVVGDIDQMIAVNCPAPTGSNGFEIGSLVGRYIDSGNYYQFRAAATVAGAVTINIYRVVNSVETFLTGTTVAGLVPSSTFDTYIRARITSVQGNGTVDLRATAWRSDQPRPITWAVSTVDASASAITAPGGIGIRIARYSGNTNTTPIPFLIRFYRGMSDAVDDLSGQAGGWTVKHFLDDGYPDQVTFISGIGIPSATVALDTPPPYLTNGPVKVAELYSPYNEASPVYGLDRDVAPVTIDHGLVTTAGPERVRVFTGQMTDIPVKGGKATMAATSATRLKLSQLVQPPAVARGGGLVGGVGLNGTWPISWTLHKCGVRPSPPPRTGVRWWVPMHGSFRPHLPDNNPLVHQDDTLVGQIPAYRSAKRTSTVPTDNAWDVSWVTGPFILGSDATLTTAEARRLFATDVELYASAGASTDLLSTAGNTGRLEFWVRGDTTNVNTAPGGSGTISNLVAFTAQNSGGTRKLQFGINTARKVFVTATDGAAHTVSLTSTATLPTDGAWYFVGAAYSISAKKLWVANDFAAAGGAITQETAAAASWVTTSLPSADVWGSGHPQFIDYLPIAEVHLTGGTQANPDTATTWLRDVTWSQGAEVSPSRLELTAIAEPQPIEAWKFMSGFAQSELVGMRTDETDVFNYLTPGWWVKPEQQVVTETISTDINAEPIDVNIDNTKIRNSVKVSYSFVEVDAIYVPVYSLSQQLFIGIGTTEVFMPFQTPVIALKNTSGNDLLYADDADFDLYNNAIPTEYISLNTNSDGSGTYATEFDGITIQKLRWNPGGVTWQFINPGPLTYYTANSKNQPAMKVFGRAAKQTSAYAQDDDTTSIAVRGARSISVSAEVQTDVDARRLASWLRVNLASPMPTVEQFTLFGDMRRQPGDLIVLQDPSITKINGQWRYTSIDHDWKVSGDSAEYTQDVTVRPTTPPGVWGTSTWGDCLWSYLT